MAKTGGPTLLQAGALTPNTPAQDTPEFRKLVPVEFIKSRVRDMMRSIPPRLFQDRVLVVESLVSSGKSTVMAAELYLEICAPSHQQMVVTQPRVMNAVTIPRDQVTPYYPQLKLGENIGWNTGKNKFRSKGLTYMTVGSFVETITVLTDDEIIERYRVIVVDEVHEMSVELASMILSLKSLFIRNRTKNLPLLVFTSATFDWMAFMKYFDLDPDDITSPNLIKVSGKSYEKLDHLGEIAHGVPSYIETAAETVIRTHKQHQDDDHRSSDILVFLPGKGEMRDLKKLLDDFLSKYKGPPFKVLLLDREAQVLNTQDYQELMAPAESLVVVINDKPVKPIRKVILSTNVAETGVTIDTLKYVIDPGYHKAREYNPSVDCYVFVTRPASKFRLTQRKGRIGRKFPGEYFPLFPQYIYDMLSDKSLGDVALTDVSPYLLSILSEQVPQLREPPPPSAASIPIGTQLTIDYPPVSNIDLVDTPSGDGLRSAYEKLYALGFVSIDNQYQYHLTKLGALASRFRGTPVELVRMILSGYFWEYSVSDLVTISAYLMTLAESPLRGPVKWNTIYSSAFQSYMFDGLHDPELYVTKTRLLVADGFIEGIILFQGWCRMLDDVKSVDLVSASVSWCEEVNVDFSFMKTLVENRDRLIEKFIIAGLDPFKYHEKSFVYADQYEFMNMVTKVKYCIYDGFRLCTLRLSPDNSHYISRLGLPVVVPPMFEDHSGTPIPRPQLLLYYGLTLKYNQKNRQYDVKPAAISLMDGFVHVDDGFLTR